jgi:predicted MFS family arabinose efflux permease
MATKPYARRTLVLASLNHALHDGFTDMIYVLLPAWQTEFALDYIGLAILRALYVGVLAALQLPSAHLARHVNGRTVLVSGTLLSAAGYALAGLSGGLVGLCASLALAGAGGSTQHPLASAAVSRAYGERARGPLGTYNFAGDLGKATLPPLLSVMLTVMHWRSALGVAAGLGILVAVLIRWLMPLVAAPPFAHQIPTPSTAEIRINLASACSLPLACWTPRHAWAFCCSCLFFSRQRERPLQPSGWPCHWSSSAAHSEKSPAAGLARVLGFSQPS